MGIGNIIIQVFLGYYSLYFIKLFRKSNRKIIREGNQKLDSLRKIPVKTVRLVDSLI